MALNPLNLGTDGALKRGITKTILVLGVAGMLRFGDVPPNPPSGGGGGYSASEAYKDTYKEQRERLEKDDNDFMDLLTIYFEQCHQ